MATLQKAIKVGSSVAVVIPKKSLKALGVKPGTSLALDIDEDSGTMTVSRASMSNDELLEWTDRFIKRYRKALERLAAADGQEWETVADFTTIDRKGVPAEDMLAALRKLDGSHRETPRRA